MIGNDPKATELQLRAEEILKRFDLAARRPIVLEFAGTPKAGKTTTISHIQAFLKRCGFRVKVVVERASICPIRDKKHFNFNVWTACTTLAQILENTQEPPGPEDPQILLLDRGLFDSICWLSFMDHQSRIRSEDREKIERFLLIDDWRKRLTGVIVMTTTPAEALMREQGFLPVKTSGSIMNDEVLAQMVTITKECIERLRRKFRIFEVSTARGSKPKTTVERVAHIVLELIDNQLTEKILHVKATIIKEIFSGKTTVSSKDARRVVEAFKKNGEYKVRNEVEDDSSAIQALPVVVVRNKSGEVLRLRRKEKDETSGLHQKIVIWAGGHVREEDAQNGDAITLAAQRELQEELRLNVEQEELQLLGAVYADAGGKTSRHVALVFEWRAETDDVAVTLSSSEFFERRGTSLSGRFVSLEALASDLDNGDLREPWSTEIVRQLLPTTEPINQALPF
jgi:predicted NUDIX family phosphoesterase